MTGRSCYICGATENAAALEDFCNHAVSARIRAAERKCSGYALLAAVLSVPSMAAVTPFPASFHTQMVPTNGTQLYVRVGGKGPAVVLLHGFADTGDMWAPLAAVLVKDHTVIVPGHWIMEENPQSTVQQVTAFLAK